MPKTFSNKPFPEATRGPGRFCLAIYLVNFVDWVVVQSSKAVAWCKLCHGPLGSPTSVCAHYNRKHSFTKENCLFCDLCKKPITGVSHASCGSADANVVKHCKGRSHLLNKMRVEKRSDFALFQENLTVCNIDGCICDAKLCKGPCTPLSSAERVDLTKKLSTGPYQELLDNMPLDKKICFPVNEHFAYVNGPCEECLGRMPKLEAALCGSHSDVMISDALCAGQSSICTCCSSRRRDSGKPVKYGSDLVIYTEKPFTKAVCVSTTAEKAPKAEPTHAVPLLESKPRTLTKKEWAALPDDEQDLYTLSRGIATLTI